MSIPKRMTISCPKCRARFDATVFQSLNTDYDKNVIDSVISGERFDAKCPQCGFVAHLEYDVLYHDMKHDAMIWVVNPNQETYMQKLVEVRSTAVPPYKTTRIVPDMNGLREKAACLAAGRDDRIVELCKIAVEGQVALQNPDFAVDKSFFTYADGKQIIYVYDRQGTELYAYLSDQIYTAVGDMYASQLEKTPVEKFAIIDHDWALKLMNTPAEVVAASPNPSADNCSAQNTNTGNKNAAGSSKDCPHCGHKIPTDSEFCQYCGKQVPQISKVEKSSVLIAQSNIPAPNSQQPNIQDSAHRLSEIELNEIDGTVPVIVEKAILFHDASNEEYYLRCSFKSLTEKKITALLADVICYDIWGNEISQIHNVQYLDLAAGRDNCFGLEKKIPISNANTRTIGINLKKIRLQDGTIIDAVGNKRKIPEVKKLLDHLKAGNLVQQYIRETTTDSIVVPVQGVDFWRCACGEINPNSDAVCYHCKQEKSRIFGSFDTEHLSQGYAAYAEQKRIEEEKNRKEREERERIEREEQERIRKEKEAARLEKERRDREIALQKEKEAAAAAKKKKRIIATIIALLIIAAAVYIIGWHGIPYYKYSTAAKNYDNGEKYAAYEGFTELGNYRDSADRANQSLYAYACDLVEAGKYSDAVPYFEKLADYLDGNDKLIYCNTKIKYDNAVELLTAKKYFEAYEIFQTIATFEDSADKSNEAGYGYAMECFNSGKYPAAFDTFDKLKKYADSSDMASEARYLYAVKCLEEENYEEATAVFEKITKYKDVADLIPNARYQYALQLEAAENWEEAYKQYKKLDKYKDSTTRYQNARYQYAIVQLDTKNYKNAVTAFVELGYYKDSKTKANEAMWAYVDGHRNKTDVTTYKYLKELKQINYKDAKKLYDLYYAYSVSLVAVNTNKNDDKTKSASVSRFCSYLHFEFKLSGGPPAGAGEILTLTHRVYWPNGSVNYSNWDWNFVFSGSTFGCYWDGFDNPSNMATGKVTIKVYNKATGEYLGEGSVRLT